VGLTLAAFLAKFEVPTIVLEAGSPHRQIGSKAIFVQRDVLELLERVGCGTAVARAGISLERGHTYFRDQRLYTTEFHREPGDFFPPFVSIPQTQTEALIRQHLEREGQVEIRWGHEVLPDFIEDEDGITLRVSGPAGEHSLRASYVVGCDGPGSVVRKSMGVSYEGESHSDKFLIVDVAIPGELMSLERHFHFDPSFNPGRQVLLIPQPQDVWRIDFQVPYETDLDAERRSGKLDQRIRRVIGDRPYELRWVSLYQFHQLVAARFVQGRALLAGDAAHLMSPFGARGMNSGMADAENLAWKLAMVLSGRAPRALLDSYEHERRAAALDNIRITSATMRFMVPPTPADQAERDAILLRSMHTPSARALVDSGKLYTPFHYVDSPIVHGEGPGPVSERAGAMGPDASCRLPGRDHIYRLRQLIGDGFLGLYLAHDLDDARRWRNFAADELLIVVDRDADVKALEGRGLVDTSGRIAAAYGPAGTLSILRPDGHLGAVRTDASPEHFGRLVGVASANSQLERRRS
jgi:3-(3-hydroxy-phenyl)propionate hydroxylase